MVEHRDAARDLAASQRIRRGDPNEAEAAVGRQVETPGFESAGAGAKIRLVSRNLWLRRCGHLGTARCLGSGRRLIPGTYCGLADEKQHGQRGDADTRTTRDAIGRWKGHRCERTRQPIIADAASAFVFQAVRVRWRVEPT